MVDFANKKQPDDDWFDKPFTPEEIAHTKECIEDAAKMKADLIHDLPLFAVKHMIIVSDTLSRAADMVEAKYGEVHVFTMQALLQARAARVFASDLAAAYFAANNL